MAAAAAATHMRALGCVLFTLFSCPVASYHTTRAGFRKSAPAKMTFDDEMLERHITQYRAILPAPGSPPPNVCDVYVRAAGSNDFWYVGKSCVQEGAGGVDGTALSVTLQRQVVVQQAKLLLPQLARAEQLELWCAPPISGFSVLDGEGGSRVLDGDVSAALSLDDVGFMPEQCTEQPWHKNDPSAFCMRLRPDGRFPLDCPWLIQVDHLES